MKIKLTLVSEFADKPIKKATVTLNCSRGKYAQVFRIAFLKSKFSSFEQTMSIIWGGLLFEQIFLPCIIDVKASGRIYSEAFRLRLNSHPTTEPEIKIKITLI